MAKREYAVGRGKPPVDNQFKKGQSGNPGGKPGPAKTFQQRFRIAFDEALKMTYEDLASSGAETVLDEVAKEIVLNAARGQSQAVKTLLALTDKYSDADLLDASKEKASSDEPTIAGGPPTAETQGVTLSQGKSQGNFENGTSCRCNIATGSTGWCRGGAILRERLRDGCSVTGRRDRAAAGQTPDHHDRWRNRATRRLIVGTAPLPPVASGPRSRSQTNCHGAHPRMAIKTSSNFLQICHSRLCWNDKRGEAT